MLTLGRMDQSRRLEWASQMKHLRMVTSLGHRLHPGKAFERVAQGGRPLAVLALLFRRLLLAATVPVLFPCSGSM